MIGGERDGKRRGRTGIGRRFGSLLVAGVLGLAPAAGGQQVLLDQLSWDGVNGLSSLNYPPIPATSSRAADDFTVPASASATWEIVRVRAVILTNIVPIAENAKIEIYASAMGGGPDTTVLLPLFASVLSPTGQTVMIAGHLLSVYEATFGDGVVSLFTAIPGQTLWLSATMRGSGNINERSYFGVHSTTLPLNGSEAYGRVPVTSPWAAAVPASDLAFKVEGRATPCPLAFGVTTASNVQTQPVSVAAGDFNNDGKPDVAVVNSFDGAGGNSVSILLGQGNGQFQTALSYAVGRFPASVAVGDFNSDGKQDLAVVNAFNGAGGNTVSVLLGNGNGTFGAPTDFATPAVPIYVAVGDFNGDGKADIATANYLGFSVSIFRGNGDGTFMARLDSPANNRPRWLAAGDFNGDGKLDLAAPNLFSDAVSVLIGIGDGTFQAPATYATGMVPSSVVTSDFDGDGKLDLAVSNRDSGDIYVFLGIGDGTFGGGASDFTGGNGVIAMALGDFNGDSLTDIALCSENPVGGKAVSFMLGNGGGSFQHSSYFITDPQAEGIAAADFNGDGKLDVAVGDFINNTAVVGLNTTATTVTGACCAPDGFCIVGTSGACQYTFLGTCTVCLPNPCAQDGPGIVNLGVLGEGSQYSAAVGVSADGFAVAVNTEFDPGEPRAARWIGGVLESLVTPGAGSITFAGAINADGSVIAGGSATMGGQSHATRWAGPASLEDLGTLPPFPASTALGINADGSVISGDASDLTGRAFRWTSQSGALTDLGVLGDDETSTSTGVSADGSTVVGTSWGTSTKAFHWTQGGGMQSLGALPPGFANSEANAASADGSVITGSISPQSAFGRHAFRWTNTGGLVDLGAPAGNYAKGLAINYDGSVIVGEADFVAEERGAMLWTQALGFVDLNTYLPSIGIPITGWNLDTCTGVSADGSVIVGTGSFMGNQRGFLVRGLPASTSRYYVGPGGGSWNDGANWSTTDGGPGGAGVPSFGHNVFITGAVSKTVNFAGSYTAPGIQSLTIGGTGGATMTLSHPSGALVIGGHLFIGGPGSDGAYLLQGGTLTAAAISNQGVLAVSNSATLDVSGVITGNPVAYSGTPSMTGGTVTAAITTVPNTVITKDTDATLTISSAVQAYGAGSVFEARQGATVFTTPMGAPGSDNLTIRFDSTAVARSGALAVPPTIDVALDGGEGGSPSTFIAGLEIQTAGELGLREGTGEVMVSEAITINVNSPAYFDIGDNTFILNHADTAGHGAAATAQVRGYVGSGRGSGTWTGTGILSRAAGTRPARSGPSLIYAVGVLNNDDFTIGGPGDPIYTVFHGVATDASSVLVQFTLYGDTDLDGDVDADDLGHWIQGLQGGLLRKSGTMGNPWYFGDFNYDGVIDFADLSLLARAYGQTHGNNMTPLLNAIIASTLSPAQKVQAANTVCAARGCVADFNNSCAPNVQDVFDFLSSWFAQSPTADVNDSGTVTIQDIFDFLAIWFLKCL